MASVVVVGTAGPVSRQRVTLAPDLRPDVLDLVPVAVERVFRGPAAPVVYVVARRDEPMLRPGGRYILYADAFGARSDVVNAVMFQRADRAARDLAWLDQHAAGGTGGVVYGRVEGGNVYDSSQPRVALAGMHVRIVADDGRADSVVTGDDGAFLARTSADGWFSVEPEVPDEWWAPPRRLQVVTGSCVTHFVVAAPNGRVSGRVLRHDGTPYDWFVDLVPTRAGALPSHLQVRADGEGRYEFAGVQPGEYLLGVNLRERQYVPHATTYYPGTPDREAAVPLIADPHRPQEGVDVRLLPDVPRADLVVRIDTRGQADEVVVCVSGTRGGHDTSGGLYAQRAPGEPVVVGALEGRDYLLTAHVERRSGHAESETVRVTAHAGQQEVVLVADRSGRAHPPNATCLPYWR